MSEEKKEVLRESLLERQMKLAKRRGVVYLTDSSGNLYRAVPVRANLKPVAK